MTSYDPLDLQSQEREKKERDLRLTLDRESEEADIKWLMSNKRGRRIVWRLLDQAGVFRLSFNTNAMTMAFSEGNRNYGLKMLGMIHALCPELYPTMLKEQKDDNRNIDDGSPKHK